MAFKRLSLSQRGDTIVEVLIAIAVVGSVLGITYSIMNRNLLTMRDNQERTEAVKQAQGQVELLKSLWATPDGQSRLGGAGGDGFCINSAGSIVLLSGGAPNADSATDGDFSGYHPDEAITNPDASCQFSGLYHVGIRRDGPADNQRYRVYVRWDKLQSAGTNEKNQVIVTYRVD